LERGEIKMDDEFFKGFNADLQNKNLWREYHTSFRNSKKKLKDLANPTQLGDPVSLKAEAANSSPKDQDRGAQPTSIKSKKADRPSLSKLAKDTTIGDPVSLESEEVANPVEGTNKNSSPSSPQSADPTNQPASEHVVAPSQSPSSSESPPLPSLPSIDATALFWSMMSASRHPDPYIFPALQKLKTLSPRFILGALTNTVIYPPGHPWGQETPSTNQSTNSADMSAYFFKPKELFDVYVASAEVGMRKPQKGIYELAVGRLDEFDRKRGGEGVKAEEVLFLDDIGENLKMAREVGMRTIRVQLGKTWRAVKELEKEAGVELMDEKTRRAKL
jgi:hypothetical protein